MLRFQINAVRPARDMTGRTSPAAGRTPIAPSLFALLLLALACAPATARAHGEHQWMSDMYFTDWWGKECCGPRDCFRTTVTYQDCDRQLRLDARCTAVITLHGRVVSLSMPRGSVHFYSKDGSPWVCGAFSIVTVGHSARCLFIPRAVGMGAGHKYGMTPMPVRPR